MTISILCPHCRSPITAGVEFAGSWLTCPRCATAVPIPLPVVIAPPDTATRDPDEDDDFDDEEPSGEYTGERCYDHGGLIRKGELVRRNVEVSTSTVLFSDGKHTHGGSVSTYERVNLCRECNQLRDDHNRRVLIACLAAFTLIGGAVLFHILTAEGKPTEPPRPAREVAVRETPAEQPVRKLKEPVFENQDLKLLQQPSKAAAAVPVRHTQTPIVLPQAPPPHVVDHSRPSPEAAFATDWQRVGHFETRVTGVLVGPAPVSDRSGNFSWTRAPVLRVWVETRSVAAGTGSFRRWGSTLDPAVLRLTSGVLVPKHSFDGGALRGELAGFVRPAPGDPAVPDVLAFEVPKPLSGNLVLVMVAEHLGERGQFRHSIPETAWKR